MYCSLFVYFSAFTRLIDKNGGFHMKPYITMEEVIETQGADSRTHRFLTEKNGCTNGCASGTTIYASTEFSDKPGVHNDQEGFYVLEGEGYAKLDDFISYKKGRFICCTCRCCTYYTH